MRKYGMNNSYLLLKKETYIHVSGLNEKNYSSAFYGRTTFKICIILVWMNLEIIETMTLKLKMIVVI